MTAAPTSTPATALAAQAPPAAPPALLEVRDLHVHFPIKSGILQRTTGFVRAVDGVSFRLARAQTLGLVGESGCGKTTVGRSVLRLIPASSGSVTFAGADVYAAAGPDLKRLRKRMQIVFQDPAGSLNPRMRVADIIGEPLRVHALARSAADAAAKVGPLLERCGMPASAAARYPHEFSGGQRQRICIARALALEPEFIVCDEPTSALDVSVQAQILNLLKDLQRDLGLSYLFISHDMAVVQHMCDRIAVMHAGKIVEEGPRADVIGRPAHPYTRSLLAAVPVARPGAKRRPAPAA